MIFFCVFTNFNKILVRSLRGNFVKNYTLEVSGRCLHTSILYLEHVQSLVSIQFRRRGDLKISLTSPKGTKYIHNNIVLLGFKSNLHMKWYIRILSDFVSVPFCYHLGHVTTLETASKSGLSWRCNSGAKIHRASGRWPSPMWAASSIQVRYNSVIFFG